MCLSSPAYWTWIWKWLKQWFRKKRLYRRNRKVISFTPFTQQQPGFPRKKPVWVKYAVLKLYHQSGLSHRKLAELFNQRYYAKTGVSVQRTWVRQLLIRYEHEMLLRQKSIKHRIPSHLPINHMWGVDTTLIQQHVVLGIIDHGSRLLITLQQLKCFNVWTFLGYLFIAFGRFGRPDFIKVDNHPVFRAQKVKLILSWINVRICFIQLASPWQNGRIERLFGTLKAYLRTYVSNDLYTLTPSLTNFTEWYNTFRPHQHLQGRTPKQVWLNIDPYVSPTQACRNLDAVRTTFKNRILRQ